MNKRSAGPSGFSLLELLICLVVMMVVTVAAGRPIIPTSTMNCVMKTSPAWV